MYTTASGVQIPQGTDSFSPTTQMKNWADKAATYENRVIVATDAERSALAAPVLRSGLECYVQATGTTWIYNGSAWLRGGLTNMRLDATNSVVQTITQVGMGKILATASSELSATVTFPVAFASPPIIYAAYIGGRSTAGAFNPAGLIDVAPVIVGKPVIPTNTTLTVKVHRTDGANLPAGWDIYYSWSAIGVPA